MWERRIWQYTQIQIMTSDGGEDKTFHFFLDPNLSYVFHSQLMILSHTPLQGPPLELYEPWPYASLTSLLLPRNPSLGDAGAELLARVRVWKVYKPVIVFHKYHSL